MYLCLYTKSWVFHGIQVNTPAAAHGPADQEEKGIETSVHLWCRFLKIFTATHEQQEFVIKFL
jgi:hypothetical protein